MSFKKRCFCSFTSLCLILMSVWELNTLKAFNYHIISLFFVLSSYHCRTKKVTLWREEQVDELKELFSDYKDSEGMKNKLSSNILSHNCVFAKQKRNLKCVVILFLPTYSHILIHESPLFFSLIMTDIMGNIISAMIKPRPRAQVVQKLLELNLITDKKDVRKKRPKGQGRRQRGKATEEVSRCIDWWMMDRWMKRWINLLMDKWIGGWLSGWIFGWIAGVDE